MSEDPLPWLDEHRVDVAAEPEALWAATARVFGASFSTRAAAAYCRAVGAEPGTAGGPRPLAAGSTVPGFRVETALPGRELALAGRHRFSTYRLVFRVEPLGRGRCRLRAESRALFPGPAGRAYRALVVGTGAHVLGMRRLLAAIRREAEAEAAAQAAASAPQGS